MDFCPIKNFAVIETTSVLMQVAIVFTFLSIFFYVYVFNTVQSSFQGLLSDSVNGIINRDSLKKMIAISIINGATAPPIDISKVMEILQLFPQSVQSNIMSDFSNILSQTDPLVISSLVSTFVDKYLDIITNTPYYNNLITYYSTDIDNSDVMDRIWIINSFLWIMLTIVIIVLKLSCVDFSVTKMIGVNIATVLLLGAIELTFFIFIGSKYIAIAPSEIATVAVNGVKTQVNS